MADKNNCDGEPMISECYVGMWALLAIPGVMIVGTALIALYIKFCRNSKKKQDPDLEMSPNNDAAKH